MDDWLVLREYVERHSEAAFETLVRRHLDMVYSAAWRQTGDADLAEDAAQAVFVLLARKAPHLGRGVMIAGWLYRTACLTARRALRDQTRRRNKNREAAEMKSTDPDEQVWIRLMPHLDAALATLGETDRTAIVLRFLERRSFRDVAVALSMSEDAAKKRVSRALEKLRSNFMRKGVTFGGGAVAAALSARATSAAPAGLLNSTVQASLSGGAAARSGVAVLVQGVMRQALISRLKWGAALAGVALGLAVIGTSNWPTPKITESESVNTTLPATPAPVANNPLRPRRERTPSFSDDRSMVLHAIADENDVPLENVAVHAEFITVPKTVVTTFETDDMGNARIALPDQLEFMFWWASAPGRVPTTIAWNSKVNVASLAPDYTLRLPQGRPIAGTVVDETGKPVAGATVHFQSEGMPWDSREYPDYDGPDFLPRSDRLPPVITDANGRWSADFISPKVNSVMGYLEHSEFETTFFGHVHPPDPIKPSTNLVLVLKRGAPVAGVVRNSGGQPIPGAVVTISSRLGGPNRGTFTDAVGHFEVQGFTDGMTAIQVNADGFKSSGVSSASGTNVDIVLKTKRVAGNSLIRGRVVATDGSSITNVSVRVAPGQPGLEDLDWTANTDADGRFVWNTAPDHPVRLEFSGASWAIWDWEKKEVELAPDGTEAVITLKPKEKVHLHGTVADKSTGRPLPEFKVLWALGYKKGYVVNTSVLTEGRDGGFAVDVLPENICNYSPPGTSTRLDFRAPGYVNKVVLLSSGTNDISLAIQLEPAKDIAGTILQPDGNPAAGARAFFHGKHFEFCVGNNCSVTGMPSPDYPFAVETRAGMDGSFRIPKIDGIDALEVVHPSGWANVSLDSRSTSVIRLQPWGQITGVVQSAQGVMPGVKVQATEAGTAPEQMKFSLSATTDADGRFEFPQVPGGRALVTVRLPQYSDGMIFPSQEAQIEPGQTINLTLSAQAQ
jgi:RNA polymerase sigma factor (sigma-70 family)